MLITPFHLSIGEPPGGVKGCGYIAGEHRLARSGETLLSGVLYSPYMSPERRPIPDWAKEERLHDLNTIGENLSTFWPASELMFALSGRGALVVDMTTQIEEGHPFLYAPEDVLHQELPDEDIGRMLRQYQPEREMVVVFLKTEGRHSSYRVQVKPPQTLSR